jgi:hypothetical protein
MVKAKEFNMIMLEELNNGGLSSSQVERTLAYVLGKGNQEIAAQQEELDQRYKGELVPETAVYTGSTFRDEQIFLDGEQTLLVDDSRKVSSVRKR